MTTTRVLVILSLTTTASRVFASATDLSSRAPELALSQHRLHPRQVPLGLPDARGVLGHAHRQLEPQVEQLLVELLGLLLKLVPRHLAPLLRFHGMVSGLYSARVRVTNLVLIPIFCAARRKPSRAVGSSTPSIS